MQTGFTSAGTGPLSWGVALHLPAQGADPTLVFLSLKSALEYLSITQILPLLQMLEQAQNTELASIFLHAEVFRFPSPYSQKIL